MRIVITRPEPEASQLKVTLEAEGCEAIVAPLMSISFANCDPIETADVQAVIATSRNGLRALERAPQLLDMRALPVFAVGRATAKEARRLRFEQVSVGLGTARDLVPAITASLDPSHGLLLHLAGDELAGDIRDELEQQGFRLLQPVVYRMVPATRLASVVIEKLYDGDLDGVILMSPRTARIWAALVQKAGMLEQARSVRHFCLSNAVATALGPLSGAPVAVPDRPSLEEMLDLIRN